MTQQYLVIHMTDATGTRLSSGDDERMLERWAAVGDAAGRLHGGAPVADAEACASVIVRDGETIVTDGPFPELKEWFAGYDLIEADSMADAAALMAQHPNAVQGRMYLLPLATLPWEQDASAR